MSGSQIAAMLRREALRLRVRSDVSLQFPKMLRIEGIAEVARACGCARAAGARRAFHHRSKATADFAVGTGRFERATMNQSVPSDVAWVRP
ncbi:hypothetical protein DNX69_11065 [Rhodopseudomonas palustris]|uniref:Uncharacterized protein n=1 Tax=Rhodopseudomonas palustris TaxID=1076 RepID=A0A323UJG6_RHOPL|nr:hypothetical protein [Rhodopseudomonas palustris]PZA12501.1 hypothetical protein DNX69_11065 [Rhodopseudomonas palustris]